MRKMGVSEYSFVNYCAKCADCLSSDGSNPREIVCRRDSCGAVKEPKRRRRRASMSAGCAEG